MVEDWVTAFGMVAASALIAMACLTMVLALQARQAGLVNALLSAGGPSTAFLLDGDRLIDASPQALSLLAGGPDSKSRAQVLARLGPMFPGLGPLLDSLATTGDVVVPSAPTVIPALVLRAEYLAGAVRLTVSEAETDLDQGRGRGAVLAALQQEVGQQRKVLFHDPTLIWCEDGLGGVTWANHAYMIRAIDLLPQGQDLTWPLPRLFTPAESGAAMPVRAKLQMQGGAEWFDIARIPKGDEVLCYAVAANAAVQAESTLREFMQTLTKTFADLPIGLAIFDRARVLQLFNPALADLTTLAPEFLIARPSLSAVLDALRAKAMLPEPRDYRSWRRQLTKVEEEAAHGVFEETWSLPGGQTYRVIGRPHPNGALAFMFEDISSEMIRTRRYRADLELGQSVIDAMDEGVAVFSQGGQLVMSNLAYSEIWQHDPAVLLSDAGIGTLCTWWRDHSAPSLIWEDAQDFISLAEDRTPWEGEVRLLDGRLLTCRFRPLTGGASMVAFRLASGERVMPRPEILMPQRLSA